MDSKNSSSPESVTPVGVIGAGSFGTAIASLLVHRTPVMVYARSEESAGRIAALPAGVTLTTDPEELAGQCEVIFPMVPSASFRDMMRTFAPFLHPYHMLIHGTKGLDFSMAQTETLTPATDLRRSEVFTMSEVISQESVVVRIGCLAGPNLAREIMEGKPAATVIASRFTEVISEGQRLLRSENFQVYGSSDLRGVELCGVLKNIMAIAAGIIEELGLGENARALLISRGLVEMIYLGRAFGGDLQAFMGLAGVGDLVATSNSTASRNFTVGRYLAQGIPLDDIQERMEETAEGINTVLIAKKMAEKVRVRAPITETLYRVLYEQLSATDAIHHLMRFPSIADVDFL